MSTEEMVSDLAVDSVSTLFDRESERCLDGRITDTGKHPAACGGHADIWKGQLAHRGVAVKVMRPWSSAGKRVEQAKMLKRLWREYLTWSSLSHPNVIELLGFSYDFCPEWFVFPALISPWMSNGTVDAYIETHNITNLIELLVGIAEGLSYLHAREPPIVHGDLRAGNVLVSDSGIPCLSDFGLSRVQSETKSKQPTTSSGPAGSLRWMSPELFRNDDGVSVHSDVWAFGMTVLEVLTGNRPYSVSKSDAYVLGQITDGILPSRPTEPRLHNDELWLLCCRCWSPHPMDRPKMSNIVPMLRVHPPLSRVDEYDVQFEPPYGVYRTTGTLNIESPIESEDKSTRQRLYYLLWVLISQCWRRKPITVFGLYNKIGPAMECRIPQRTLMDTEAPGIAYEELSWPLLVHDPFEEGIPLPEIFEEYERIFSKDDKDCLNGSVARVRDHRLGNHADVWKGDLGLLEVAIKTIRPFTGPISLARKRNILERLWLQYTRATLCQHPNVLHYVGFSYDVSPQPSDFPALISAWMLKGTLSSYLTTFPEANLYELALGVGLGLEYLHAQKPPIVHGDVRAENILILEAGVPCISVVCVTDILKLEGVYTSVHAVSSLRWMSPKLLQNDSKPTSSSDVWAYGMTLLEMFSRNVPYQEEKSPASVLSRIRAGHIPIRPASIPDVIWSICLKCWDVSNWRRPSTMRTVLYELKQRGLISMNR